MIYLFTTTARDQYIQDALDILALPSGAVHRFRYTKRRLTSQTAEHLKALFGDSASMPEVSGSRAAMIVFVHLPKEESERRPETAFYYPLRRVDILRYQEEGTVVSILFKVGDFVNLTKLASQARQLAHEAVIKALETQIQTGNVEADQWPHEWSIALGSELEIDTGPLEYADQSEASSAWEAIVDNLGTMNELANTVFYRVMEILDVTPPSVFTWRNAMSMLKRAWDTLPIRRSANRVAQSPIDHMVAPEHGSKPLSLTSIVPETPGYVLNSHQMYVLRLSFYQPKEVIESVRGSKIVTVVDKLYFAFAPDPIEITFRYDARPITLITGPLVQDAYTPLSIRLQPIDMPGRADGPPFRAPYVSFVLRILFPRKRTILTFAALFVGQLSVAVSGILGENQPWRVLLAFVGASVTTGAVFFLLRRFSSAPR